MEYSNKYDKFFINYALTDGCVFDWKQFKAQGIAESLLKPNATSPAGAIGIMQVMPKTGEWLGYKTAQLFDPEMNIKAGIEYMMRLWQQWVGQIYDQQELWYFCLGSYNAGPGNIDKAFARAKEAKSEFRDWSVVGGLYLPGVTGEHARETINYVARIKRIYRTLKTN